jgi:hypothetical protein
MEWAGLSVNKPSTPAASIDAVVGEDAIVHGAVSSSV